MWNSHETMKTCLRSQSYLFCVLAIIAQLSVVAPLWAKTSLQLIDENTLADAKKQYGIEAQERLLEWQDLVREDTSTTEMEKLIKVNHFFNQIRFVSDSLHWKQNDYWATPVEFLASGGGDCEDFSLAKYFTLKAMGIEEKKLNLTYVKAIELKQAHMVMTYFKTPEADPLVLDNLIDTIKLASQRLDLLPVYSFNGAGLWLAKQRGRGKYLGGSERLRRWQDFQGRMPKAISNKET